MNQNTKVRNVATALFGAVSALFLIFFIYMGLFENVAVYSAREFYSYGKMTDFSVEQIADETAPVGIRTIYRRVLDTSEGEESKEEICLCFYLVHHYAQIFYDDELVYSLTANGDNRIGDSIGSNWVTVPIYPEDVGKDLVIVLTPLFENMVDFEPEFLIGSRFSIILDQLIQNIPQLLTATLCILVGIFIMAVQLYLTLRAEIQGWNMFFMGAFAIFLGLWQITGSKSSPILFAGNPMVLGYITIGVLFLCGTPLLLFASTYFEGKKTTFLRVLSAIGSVVAAFVLLLQVLGVADFKETLVVSHIMLIVTICAIAAMALFHRKKDTRDDSRKSWRLLLLPAAGIVIDMTLFYVSDSSSDLFFATLIAFIVYALITFVIHILETTEKAYTDSRTGLTNKLHWNELMNVHVSATESTAIMMLDLNGLKQVNDTLGHDAGDKMILNFSNILRNSLPKNSTICRWGGDEFAVMITDTNKQKVEEYINTIRQAVDDYNTACGDPPIFYAVGCALSTDYPGLSRMELLSKADSQMYLDKRRWYSERENTAER